MALSRKRRKELKRLRTNAGELWGNQKDLFGHASKVAREAGHQANLYAREEVGPRVRGRYDSSVRPAVRSATSATRSKLSDAQSAYEDTRARFAKDVMPGLAAALGNAMTAIEMAKHEVAKNDQVRGAVESASKFGNDVGTRFGLVQPKPKPKSGPLKAILIGVGVVSFAALAYAAWQTLRADDELWVEETPVEAGAVDNALPSDS